MKTNLRRGKKGKREKVYENEDECRMFGDIEAKKRK
jgi:hypothetical protein